MVNFISVYFTTIQARTPLWHDIAPEYPADKANFRPYLGPLALFPVQPLILLKGKA